MSLGTRLREVRTRQAVSLPDLAARAGLSASYIAKVEAGYEVPSHETLEIWAQALEVPFYRLFFSKPEAAGAAQWSTRFSQHEAPQGARASTFRMLRRWLRQALSRAAWKIDTSEETYHHSDGSARQRT
jgi:transcriptional regulator with XRE-family HTH domain